jgi:hypothetical protein
VIVSPTTLLATLRVIDSLWKQERQSQNAREIAERAGWLYDKFVLFIQDLDEVGNRLQQLDKAYSSARNKLTDGRGNLVSRSEQLKLLGARASKSLPADLLERAMTDVDGWSNCQSESKVEPAAAPQDEQILAQLRRPATTANTGSTTPAMPPASPVWPGNPARRMHLGHRFLSAIGADHHARHRLAQSGAQPAHQLGAGFAVVEVVVHQRQLRAYPSSSNAAHSSRLRAVQT